MKLSILKILLLAAGLATTGQSVAGKVDYDVAYEQYFDPDLPGPYHTKAKITFKVEDARVTKLLMSSFYGHISKLSDIYLMLYRPSTDNESPQTISKMDGVSIFDSDYYVDRFSRQLIRCINTVPEQEVGDPIVFAELVRLLETPIPKIEFRDIDETVYRLMPALKKLSDFYERNDRTCPEGDPVKERLDPIRDFDNVLEAMKGVFNFGRSGPGIGWTAVTKSLFFEIIAPKNGFWYKETEKEVEDMFIIMVGDVSIDASYVSFLSKKSFSDFLGFSRELREYLKSQSVPMIIAKTIGTSCLASVEEVFEPFSLKSCMDAGKLEAVPTGNPGTVFLVPGPAAPITPTSQGE